jgi:hypothetical protein
VAASSAAETGGQSRIGAVQRGSGRENWNASRMEFACCSRSLRMGMPKSSSMNLSTEVKS